MKKGENEVAKKANQHSGEKFISYRDGESSQNYKERTFPHVGRGEKKNQIRGARERTKISAQIPLQNPDRRTAQRQNEKKVNEDWDSEAD